jgi:hypothetical protein
MGDREDFCGGGIACPAQGGTSCPAGFLQKTLRFHLSLFAQMGFINKAGIMSYKRKIVAELLVQDIRSGMSDVSLMEKYMLSERGLNKVFRKLLDHGAMSADELSPRIASHADLTPLNYLRESTPHELVCLVPIYEESQQDARGSVCELTERGVGVTGLEAAVDDLKKFVIPADEFFSVLPFSFYATCRWVAQQDKSPEPVAGFEITDISDDDYQRLRQLIRVLKLPA